MKNKSNVEMWEEDSLKGMYEKGKKEERERILKILNENKIYPQDIFPELSDYQLQSVNDFLISSFRFPLDRLSAHIARVIIKGLRLQIKEEKA